MWILIVIGVYSGGFGFSQEFSTKTDCENAKNTISYAIQKLPAYAYCVAKGIKNEKK